MMLRDQIWPRLVLAGAVVTFTPQTSFGLVAAVDGLACEELSRAVEPSKVIYEPPPDRFAQPEAPASARRSRPRPSAVELLKTGPQETRPVKKFRAQLSLDLNLSPAENGLNSPSDSPGLAPSHNTMGKASARFPMDAVPILESFQAHHPPASSHSEYVPGKQDIDSKKARTKEAPATATENSSIVVKIAELPMELDARLKKGAIPDSLERQRKINLWFRTQFDLLKASTGLDKKRLHRELVENVYVFRPQMGGTIKRSNRHQEGLSGHGCGDGERSAGHQSPLAFLREKIGSVDQGGDINSYCQSSLSGFLRKYHHRDSREILEKEVRIKDYIKFHLFDELNMVVGTRVLDNDDYDGYTDLVECFQKIKNYLVAKLKSDIDSGKNVEPENSVVAFKELEKTSHMESSATRSGTIQNIHRSVSKACITLAYDCGGLWGFSCALNSTVRLIYFVRYLHEILKNGTSTTDTRIKNSLEGCNKFLINFWEHFFLDTTKRASEPIKHQIPQKFAETSMLIKYTKSQMLQVPKDFKTYKKCVIIPHWMKILLNTWFQHNQDVKGVYEHVLKEQAGNRSLVRFIGHQLVFDFLNKGQGDSKEIGLAID